MNIKKYNNFVTEKKIFIGQKKDFKKKLINIRLEVNLVKRIGVHIVRLVKKELYINYSKIIQIKDIMRIEL